MVPAAKKAAAAPAVAQDTLATRHSCLTHDALQKHRAPHNHGVEA